MSFQTIIVLLNFLTFSWCNGNDDWKIQPNYHTYWEQSVHERFTLNIYMQKNINDEWIDSMQRKKKIIYILHRKLKMNEFHWHVKNSLLLKYVTLQEGLTPKDRCTYANTSYIFLLYFLFKSWKKTLPSYYFVIRATTLFVFKLYF